MEGGAVSGGQWFVRGRSAGGGTLAGMTNTAIVAEGDEVTESDEEGWPLVRGCELFGRASHVPGVCDQFLQTRHGHFGEPAHHQR
ncbi:hypothetical protein Abr02nite_58900 [Paractinoplanes brasiliensis]|nr:hypothetical protein Abr02nite_58900 [Actinoplanes brasiliensis]